MVHVPSDASDSGNRRSAASAAACASPSVTPDFANHHVAVDVDLADRAQALGRDDDLLAAQIGRLATDEAGVAALRNHADPRLVAEGRDIRDFLGRTRPHQRKRLSLIELARLDERAREQRGVGQHVPRAHDILQARRE